MGLPFLSVVCLCFCGAFANVPASLLMDNILLCMIFSYTVTAYSSQQGQSLGGSCYALLMMYRHKLRQLSVGAALHGRFSFVNRLAGLNGAHCIVPP